LKIKLKRKNEEWNVLRISGGECLTIIPEILIDIYKEIKQKAPNTYIWIDTNLSNLKYLKKYKKELKELFKNKNIGVVGCFKGIDESDFSILTGVDKKFYKNQFKVAKFLIDLGADIYFYLPALIYKNNIETKIESFVKQIRKIHINLPLRVEIIPIIDYPATKVNKKIKSKEGRLMPDINQKDFFGLWYNKILKRFYSKKELEKYCCEIPIN